MVVILIMSLLFHGRHWENPKNNAEQWPSLNYF